MDKEGRRSFSTAPAAHFEPSLGNLARVRQEILAIWSANYRRERSRLEGEQMLRSPRVHTYHEKQAPWFRLDRDLSSDIAGETGAVSIYVGADRALAHLRGMRAFVDAAKFYLSGGRLRPRSKPTSGDLHGAAQRFVTEHLATERKHLGCFENLLRSEEGKFTRLLGVWRACGFLLGYLPTLVRGPVYLYHTVDAVETFVDEHYQEQIDFVEAEVLATIVASRPGGRAALQPCAKSNKALLGYAGGRSDLSSERAPPAPGGGAVQASGTQRLANLEGLSLIHDSRGKPTLALLGLLRSFRDDEVGHAEDAKHRLAALVKQESDRGILANYGIGASVWRWIVGKGSAVAAELARRV